MNPDSLPAQIRIEFVVTPAGHSAYVAHPAGVKAPSTDRGKSLDPDSVTAAPSTIILSGSALVSGVSLGGRRMFRHDGKLRAFWKMQRVSDLVMLRSGAPGKARNGGGGKIWLNIRLVTAANVTEGRRQVSGTQTNP